MTMPPTGTPPKRPPVRPDQTPANRPTASTAPGLPSTAPPHADRPEGGLFRKRADAIGPAPLFFSIALGLTFGISLGLLLGQPVIGAVFGAMLGALYGLLRRQGARH